MRIFLGVAGYFGLGHSHCRRESTSIPPQHAIITRTVLLLLTGPSTQAQHNTHLKLRILNPPKNSTSAFGLGTEAMIRRKFMKFAPKEHSDEKVKANLQKHNVPVFEGKDPVKFGQYGSVAKDLGAKAKRNNRTDAPEGGEMASAEKTFQWQQKALYSGGTGAGASVQDSRNPYAMAQPQGNPYASAGGNPYGAPAGGNPYGAPTGGAPGSGASSGSHSRATGSSGSSRPYGPRESGSTGAGSSNPYSAEPGSYRRDSASTAYPSSASLNSYKPGSNPSGYAAGNSGANSTDYSSTYGESSFAKDDDFDEEEYLFGSSSKPGNAGNSAGAPARATGGYAGGYGSSRNDFSRSNDLSRSDFQAPSQSEAAAPGEGSPPTAGTTTGIYSNYRRNQSTEDTTDIRNELFGNAPQRLNPDDDEFDELNRTTTELRRDEDLELTASNLDRPVYATNNAGGAGPSGLDAPIEEEEDELNALPSEFAANNDAYGGDSNPGYSSGQQLFEDSEDEDVEYVKREIRQTKQDSVESTRRALEVAREAELSGTNALGMLGNQGERLGGTAKTVALGNVQARTGDRNADELIRLNRSIFIPNISNPFNSRRRNQLKEQRLRSERAMDELESQELEMKQREADRRVAEGLTAAGPSYSETVMRQRVRMNRDNPERKMYQFEADSDDDALEDELGGNLDEISNATNRLHNLSLKIQEEVDDQNVRVDRMGNRVDALDMSLLKSTAKMSSIN